MLSSNKIPFCKYQGTGNDFILIDDRKRTFPVENSSLIEKMCHRKFGIGADGLILLQSSQRADFRMRIFNSDGFEAASCGNGLCCLMRFLVDLGHPTKKARIEMMKGEVTIEMEHNPIVHLHEPSDLHLNAIDEIHFLNTGVPHAVVFSSNIQSVDVASKGKELRWHPFFQPDGTNVNFAEIKPDGIHVRTFERGVEGETLACGTGATAVALIAHLVHKLPSPIKILFKGGPLQISFESQGQKFKNVRLMGSAAFVFSGAI